MGCAQYIDFLELFQKPIITLNNPNKEWRECGRVR